MSQSQSQGDGNGPLAALSLLSLAASQASPESRPVPRSVATTAISQPSHQPFSVLAPVATIATTIPVIPLTPAPQSPTSAFSNNASRGLGRGSALGSQPKARRLSSASQSKRRMSDATAATFQAAATADFVRGTSVVSNSGLAAATASLSLSTSPAQPRSGSGNSVKKGEVDLDAMDEDTPVTGSGKKKGTIYKCETCSKAYRHPNCLLKHRWEHSPHWREASKFLLSKHQQVQLLEAAAILSHLTPRDGEGEVQGTSLPDDRALWPSFLSGGLLPVPSTKTPSHTKTPSLSGIKKLGVSLSSGHRSKKEDSSEEEASVNGGDTSSKITLKGSSAASLPTSTGFGGTVYTKGGVTTLSKPVTASPTADDKSSTSGDAKEDSFSPNGFYYGSIGAIPTQPTGFSGHKKSTSLSFQPQYMSSAPPYARQSGHRRGHTRTSSVSSSYTRSSIRGGADEDEEDDAEDVGYLDKGSYYGSVTSMSSPSVAASHKKTRNISGSGEDYEFDVLDERDEREDEDTVDEESDENHGTGGAGMEIDMEL